MPNIKLADKEYIEMAVPALEKTITVALKNATSTLHRKDIKQLIKIRTKQRRDITVQTKKQVQRKLRAQRIKLWQKEIEKSKIPSLKEVGIVVSEADKAEVFAYSVDKLPLFNQITNPNTKREAQNNKAISYFEEKQLEQKKLQ